jgi:hypothetical protein
MNTSYGTELPCAVAGTPPAKPGPHQTSRRKARILCRASGSRARWRHDSGCRGSAWVLPKALAHRRPGWPNLGKPKTKALPQPSAGNTPNRPGSLSVRIHLRTEAKIKAPPRLYRPSANSFSPVAASAAAKADKNVFRKTPRVTATAPRQKAKKRCGHKPGTQRFPSLPDKAFRKSIPPQPQPAGLPAELSAWLLGPLTSGRLFKLPGKLAL